MTFSRMIVTLFLVLAMAVSLVLLRAEETRIGRRLEETRRLQDELHVQLERIMCEKAGVSTPRFLQDRALAFGLQLSWPGDDPESMLARLEQ